MATSDTTSSGQAPSLAEALAQLQQLRAQLAAEQRAGARLQEANIPIQYVRDSVHFLRGAFDDLSTLCNAYREALASLKSTHTTAAAQLAQLRALEVECDFDFMSVEVPKAFERTLASAECVAGIVQAMKEELAQPHDADRSAAALDHPTSRSGNPGQPLTAVVTQAKP